MKIELRERELQYAYFIGYVAGRDSRLLNEAKKTFLNDGVDISAVGNVFGHCPHNDNIKQILWGYNIYSNGKKKDLLLNLIELIGEFVFLVSDFSPPCCGDGRAFYCLTVENQVCMECDRCNQLYNLSCEAIFTIGHRKMTKKDFLSVFPEIDGRNWFSRKELAIGAS